MARAQMRSTGPAASISTSTLKHNPSSSSRMPDTPSTLVGQLSSHDLKGMYASSEWVHGRRSPQSSGLKRQAAVRPETPPKKLPMESSFVANQKMTSSSPHLMASSLEKSHGGRRRAATPPVAYVTRQTGATSGPAVSATNALDLNIHVSRQSKPLPAIAPSPSRPIFAEVLSASPSSMGTSELPVYSSDESRSTSTRRRRTRQPGSRTSTFGSRRHGGMISQLCPEYSSSSSSDSDSDSIARSHDSVSTRRTGSTDNRSSRYARLLDAIGI